MFGVDAISKVIEAALNKFIPDANIAAQAAAEAAKTVIREIELEVQDRDSARKREMEVKDYTPSVLVFVITALLAVDLWYFNTHPPHADIQTLVQDVTTALRDGWIMAIAYYFGSSYRRSPGGR